MSLPPQKFREIVFQLLFSMDVGDSQEEDLIPFLMKELSVTRRAVKEAHQIAQAIGLQIEELDKKIESFSQSFALERIGKVERNVLRLGFFELQSLALPAEIVISETIRLARKFSTPEAASFVNALMDACLKEQKTDVTLSSSPQ